MTAVQHAEPVSRTCRRDIPWCTSNCVAEVDQNGAVVWIHDANLPGGVTVVANEMFTEDGIHLEPPRVLLPTFEELGLDEAREVLAGLTAAVALMEQIGAES